MVKLHPKSVLSGDLRILSTKRAELLIPQAGAAGERHPQPLLGRMAPTCDFWSQKIS